MNAGLQGQDTAIEDADDIVEARGASESSHRTAAQPNNRSPQLPASQSNAGQLEDNEEGEGEQGGSKQKKPKQTSDAVLPWMRLPVNITAGQGVQLSHVVGLDARLRDKLRAGQLRKQTSQSVVILAS